MRLVSWNMKRRKSNWEYLLDTLQPDVALLQESGKIDRADMRKKAVEAEVKPHFRNTVYSPLPLQKVKLPQTAAGREAPLGQAPASRNCKGGDPQFNTCTVDINGFGKIFFIGIYLRYPRARTTRDIHTLGTLGRITWILRETYGAEHIIIGGDFNLDPVRMDDPKQTWGRGGYKKFHGLFHNIRNLGFTDCVPRFYPDGVQTHRHNRSDYPWQIDHIFATDVLCKKLKRLEVVVNDDILKISDHNPIIADFDF